MTWSSPSGRQDQGAKTEANQLDVPATVPRTHGTQHDALLNAFPPRRHRGCNRPAQRPSARLLERAWDNR